MIRNLGEGTTKKIMPGLRMPPEARLRAVLMIFGDNPCSTRIDLIQWNGSDTEGQAHQHLWHAGMCRIALHPHAMKDYEDLKTKGIQFWTEPILIKTEQQ